MRITLKPFQEDYVAELHQQFQLVAQIAGSAQPAALLLNAPTGSGKTMMATAFIEELLLGTESNPADPNFCFLWLTDQPELNKQTVDKMLESSELPTETFETINGGFRREQFLSSRVYFLNTQKLGSNTSFVKPSDDRPTTLWESIRNTVTSDPRHFVLIIDEAHRGTQGRDAAEAETILQKFIKGSKGEIPPIPIVVGISATPERFVKLCVATNRPVFTVDVEPERVRESGLLKELVDLYHLDERQPGDVTMLIQAVKDWLDFKSEWHEYGAEQHELAPSPVLVVQVEDAKSGSPTRSRTDLSTLVRTLLRELGDEATEGWLAHSFQDDSSFVVDGHSIRYLAPSEIDRDGAVKVVLFKTSLNTGWDCPRAEVMVSFRTAKDETAITQLVGRMVRAPLGRRIDANEHLNAVSLYLPHYDTETVERIVLRLTGDPGLVPPTRVRLGRESLTLSRSVGTEACFNLLGLLPSYTVPPRRSVRPVPRLGKLASLLAATGLEESPVKEYRRELVDALVEERNRLHKVPSFRELLDESRVLDVRRRRVVWGLGPSEAPRTDLLKGKSASLAVRAIVAAENVDDLFSQAGRQLGEGIHKEYLRSRMEEGTDPQTAKLEFCALMMWDGTQSSIEARADALRVNWTNKYKPAFAQLDERYRQTFRDIQGAGADSVVITLELPPTIQWQKAQKRWPKHLYVDQDGLFPEDFARSSWEARTVELELQKSAVVAWFRNPARKPWSLCITRWEDSRFVPFYPDLIFFRKTPSGVIPDIIDPHLLAAEDMPQRAVRMAQYAQMHGDRFGRIEMVIYSGPGDTTGKRIDLTNEELRDEVAGMTTTQQLRNLFERM